MAGRRYRQLPVIACVCTSSSASVSPPGVLPPLSIQRESAMA
jgi:hypothetical protein